MTGDILGFTVLAFKLRNEKYKCNALKKVCVHSPHKNVEKINKKYLKKKAFSRTCFGVDISKSKKAQLSNSEYCWLWLHAPD